MALGGTLSNLTKLKLTQGLYMLEKNRIQFIVLHLCKRGILVGLTELRICGFLLCCFKDRFFLVICVFQTIGATFAAMIGAGMLVQSIPYDQSPGPKHLAWLLHSGMFWFPIIIKQYWILYFWWLFTTVNYLYITKLRV